MTITNLKPLSISNQEVFSSGQKFHCDNCQSNLTDIVRISCFECPEFDLCITCFANGAEIGNHKYYHKYSVISKNTFPIFSPDWTADEELMLIDGLLQFGMGNWEETAIYVGTRTKEECELHYNTVYIDSKDWPLPNMTLELDHKTINTRAENPIKLEPKIFKVLSSQPSNHEIAGYMPGREEFEVEIENDAEQLIKDLSFGEDDNAEEKLLKQTILEIYNSKLGKRNDRKSFLLERNLIDYTKNSTIEKRKTNQERDLLNKIKVFAKIQSKNDFNLFSQGLQNELALKNRIDQLKEWRSNGITTFTDGSVYKSELANRLGRTRTVSMRECIQNLEKIQKLAVKHVQRQSGTDNSSAIKYAAKKSSISELKEVDGAHLLSIKELELCDTNKLKPRSYILLKDILLNEYLKTGSLTKENASSLLNVNKEIVFAIYDFMMLAGPDFYIYDGSNNKVVATSNTDFIQINNAIRNIGVSGDSTLFALITENKKLVVVNAETFSIVNHTETLKKCNAVCFDEERNVVVADKFGDAIMYKTETFVPETLLGHVSILTDIAICKHGNKQLILTSDRDEKIRVSSYPNSYNILSFCLGHEEFVSCFEIPIFNQDYVISGSGDGSICVFHISSGSIIQKINLGEILKESLGNETPKEIGVLSIKSTKYQNGEMYIAVIIESVPFILFWKWEDKKEQKMELDKKISLLPNELPNSICFNGEKLYVSFTNNKNTNPSSLIRVYDENLVGQEIEFKTKKIEILPEPQSIFEWGTKSFDRKSK
ncbi:hypothetical protein BB559_000216 [Furculomyces boomerangus]|uniref:Uncharacterized protein n=1 Tax=Furculomyces boomerangus TaxID=61424 RepID=A0A2T9Z5T6_9FUNG|nr:hypothetical protein BB559_000216 [Furculomyces boomerangus]